MSVRNNQDFHKTAIRLGAECLNPPKNELPEKLGMKILEGDEAVAYITGKILDALPQWAKQQIADQQVLIGQLMKAVEGLIPLCECNNIEHSRRLSFANAVLAAAKEITSENS